MVDGYPRKCSAVPLRRTSRSTSMDVRSTMSCVRRVVPVPSMRVAFTDIDCLDALAFGMPPEHDHAMLGPQLQGSNPPVMCRPSHPTVPSTISVGSRPLSDPIPTEIASRRDLGRIRVRFPFAAGRSTHVRVMHMTDIDDWARNHHGLITKAASGLSDSAWQAGDAVRPVDRHPPGSRPTPRHRRHRSSSGSPLPCWRRAPRRIASHRSATYLWGDPTAADRSRRRHRATTPSAAPLCAACRYHRPTDHLHLDPATTSRHPRAPTSCARCATSARSTGHAVSGSRRPRADAQTGDAGRARGVADRPLERRAGPASPPCATAIDDWSIDSRPADSVLEPAMRRLVTRYHLPRVEFHPDHRRAARSTSASWARR